MNSFSVTKLVIIWMVFATKRDTVISSKHMNASPHNCSSVIVETTPQGMVPSKHLSTFDAWKSLIENAENTIEIGSYGWHLRPYEYFEKDSLTIKLGSKIYESLLHAGLKRNISIKIVRYQKGPTQDTEDLVAANAAEVRNVDVTTLLKKPGIMHAKFIIVDRKHIYTGSANFRGIALAQRSGKPFPNLKDYILCNFFQNKEIGIVVGNCTSIANDLGKIFDTYWELGKENTWNISKDWHEKYNTHFNSKNPFQYHHSNHIYNTYISNSPKSFSTPDRTTDLDSIFDVMDGAEKYIFINLMEYYPIYRYETPKRYWPDVDTKLKNALISKGVKVKMLIGDSVKNIPSTIGFLRSLQSFNGSLPYVDVHVKYYVVPKLENETITDPHCRIVHSKYIVTEKTAYFGNSNWGGEYMTYSTGVGLVITPIENEGESSGSNIRDQLEEIFQRDWESPYAKDIEDFPKSFN